MQCIPCLVFLAFIFYPIICYGLYLDGQVELYERLFDDSRYLAAAFKSLGIRYAFTTVLPRLGVAVMTALPMLFPLVIILMRKRRTKEGQL